MLTVVYMAQRVAVVKECCIVGFQGEWKLVALSAPYRLKRPDRRFEELKNYSTELQTHINNIIKIRTVSTHFSMSTSLLCLSNCAASVCKDCFRTILKRTFLFCSTAGFVCMVC